MSLGTGTFSVKITSLPRTRKQLSCSRINGTLQPPTNSLPAAFCALGDLRYSWVRREGEEGDDVLVVDSRPLDEYQTRNIPGAIDVPGVELVYHIDDLVQSPETLVVVNCGGRTRSIIGAQLLINAGLRNRVVALENGTMGWHLAGYPLEHGQTRRPPRVTNQGLAWSRASALRMAERFGVAHIDHATLAHWCEDGQRTVYLFDVRQLEEYLAGHLPNARHVQGGQLVQETDRYIAVRNARIVLCDGTDVRAIATAGWLRQMGFSDVYVLRDSLASTALESGPWRPTVLGGHAATPGEIHAKELLGGNLKEVTVIDLAASPNYRRGHIPGAHFAIRAQMTEALLNISQTHEIVLTSEDGILARSAAPEVGALSGRIVRPLVGGTEAWCVAGGELEQGNERWGVPPHDVWLKPFDQREGKVEDRLNTYLKWELHLLEQIDRDGSIRFAIAPEVADSM